MTPERWRQVEELYHEALAQEAPKRAAFLAEACPRDDELRREVESLLAQHASRAGPLDRPAADLLGESTRTRFTIGSQLGPYRIESLLGAGGMGVVYKAFDTKLNRAVALKFLPHNMRYVEELKQRLTEEARAASALDHPNIVVIYDIDEVPGGDLFIAMAFHDGVTLREKITTGLAVTEALGIARQIALGLTKAHEHSIFHRDIKPSNIIVAKDGVARIIDFGLAKSTEATATMDGTTKGTPLYMSPEQASGKAVDFRTDLWSLGVVLYEMLAGKPPFQADSQLAVLHAILHDTPLRLRQVRPDLPLAIDAIVYRALEKDPAKRYQSAGEMARDLSAELAGLDAAGASGARVRTARSFSRRLVYAAAALAALVTGVFLAWRLGATRYLVTSTSEYIQLTNFNDSATAPALSPDGRMLTFFRGGSYFLSAGQIYVKMLPDGGSRQLTYDSSAKYDPVFTPDGARVAYSVMAPRENSWGDTWTVPVLGGSPMRLMANAAGLSWIGPDRVLFSEVMAGSLLHMGIVTARESRSEERAIYFPAHERAMAHYSSLSPDRSSILIVEMDPSGAWQRCRLVPMDGKSAGTQVGPNGVCTAAAWSPDGKWAYFTAEVGGSRHLWRQRWRDHALDGNPEQITFGPTEEEGLAVVPDGRSLIASVGVRQSSVWTHDSSGDHMVSLEGSASAPWFSADGKRLYYLLQRNNLSDVEELWLRDLVSGRSDPLLTGLRILDYDLSQDEALVAFTVAGTEGKPEIFVAAADRSSPPRLVVRGGDTVSFGGRQLVFRQVGATANYLARVQTDGKGLERIVETPILGKSGASQDGKWAVASGVGTLHATFAFSVQNPVRRQICAGGCEVAWSPDGKYLYLTRAMNDENGPNGRTYIIPIPGGAGLPDLPPAGLDTSGAWPAGVRSIPPERVAPGPDPDTYAFTKSAFQGNLFRIPLH